MFDRKKKVSEKAEAEELHSRIMYQPTMYDKLMKLYSEKQLALTALEQELMDLDAQIAWFKRHPEAEKVLTALQKRAS